MTRIQTEIEQELPEDGSREGVETGEFDNVLDDDFWQKEAAIFLPPTVAMLTAGAIRAIEIEAEILESSFQISVDWTLANSEAAAWARSHGSQLITQITDTTKRNVNETVATWVETPESTVGQLFETLRTSYGFSEARARNIGVTETTNAYSEGRELAYVESGIPSAIFKPTAHPNCRCWDAAILLPNSTWVIVWRTNMDELVCKRPIPTGTALGTVAGCRELENMVISAGAFLGDKLSEARRAVRTGG